MVPEFFADAAEFRRWLSSNHDKADEILVGFLKTGSGRAGMTWPESVDQALCFGWIDGVRRRIDDESYSIRFTPRRPQSVWSAINIAKVTELKKKGLMHAAGLAAFDQRDDKRSVIYSYENERVELEPAFKKKFLDNKEAWAFFEKQPDWYRRQKVYWIYNAKQAETRVRRLEKLITSSKKGERI